MQTKTKTTTTPAPKPDAQPVQAASFTPGPWTNKDTLVMTSEGNYVADCGMSYMIPDYEKHANARLIAAAPALLAALESMVSTALKVEDKAWASAIDRAGQTRPCDAARAALDAAKGGAQ